LTSRNKIGLAVLGTFLVVGAARLWLGLHSQPQLPPSEEIFKSVDALFTAVTSRDQQRLAACATRLNIYKQQGLIPAASSKRLEQAIRMARIGEWESAARRLYDFMQGQRRAGPASQRGPQQTAMNHT
jgi:hypothetical protein